MYKYLSSCDVRNLKLILTWIFSTFFFDIFLPRPVLSSIDSDSAANGRDRFFPPRCERRLVHALTLALLRWTRTHTHTPFLKQRAPECHDDGDDGGVQTVPAVMA